MNFYELREPSEWAAPPSMWSSTSLDTVETCPRRWQLLNSRWGDFERFPLRPHPAAIEGQIVHDALDRLTRACGQRGNPPFGSTEFSAALSDAEFFTGFTIAVSEWVHRLATHPRPGPLFSLRTSAEELTNRAIRMFRDQYKPGSEAAAKTAERASDTRIDLMTLLKQKQALSEIKLSHSRLPFLGILDRVQIVSDQVEIIDFKTGKPSENHRQQLQRYAILWWRKTGQLPLRVTAQYLDGCQSWTFTEDELSIAESDLADKLGLLTEQLSIHPAEARPSNGCKHCPVRAYCEPGWMIVSNSAMIEGQGDLELIVLAKASEYGFLAHSRSGIEVSVVYEAAISRLIPELKPGQILRIINGTTKETRTQIEIKAWTEMLLC